MSLYRQGVLHNPTRRYEYKLHQERAGAIENRLANPASGGAITVFARLCCTLPGIGATTSAGACCRTSYFANPIATVGGRRRRSAGALIGEALERQPDVGVAALLLGLTVA